MVHSTGSSSHRPVANSFRESADINRKQEVIPAINAHPLRHLCDLDGFL